MRIFRKRKESRNRDGVRDAEPLPDIVHQIAAEQAANFVALKERQRQAYAAMHPYELVPPLPDVLEIPMARHQVFVDEDANDYADEVERPSSPLATIASALGISRSSSRENFHRDSPIHFARPDSPSRFSRAGSPEHFRYYQPGARAEFRHRSPSPEIIRPRSSSPYLFNEYNRSSSPHHFIPPVRSTPADIERRFRRAQLSQELQNFERQQRFQEEMMMRASFPYIPQYQHVQQPYYSLNPVGSYQIHPIAQQQIYSPYY